MHYQVILKKGKYDFKHYSDDILDFIPLDVVRIIQVSFIQETMGIDCNVCPFAGKAHVCIRKPETHTRYYVVCSVLFHDMVKPIWKLEDIK